MTPNPGYCPEEAIGKRVRVLLAHGGMGTGDPNDIAEYEVIK